MAECCVLFERDKCQMLGKTIHVLFCLFGKVSQAMCPIHSKKKATSLLYLRKSSSHCICLDPLDLVGSQSNDLQIDETVKLPISFI